MRTRQKTILFSCLMLISFCLFFSWTKGQCDAPMPVPSHSSGFYSESFVLELTAPVDGQVYYTLDGSVPTTNSKRYQDGIVINNRSREPNIYNSVVNIIADWKDYVPDSTPVQKGTVLRAIFVNQQGFQSDILTQTYFVGIQPPERGYVLSLAFDFQDFFGDNGIYVTGKEYDDWYLSENRTENTPIPNFEKDMEVPATMELMDIDGDILVQNIGVKLQGASARGAFLKRFTLVSRSEYSGSDVFGISLFNDTTTHSVMLKNNIPDAIVAELVNDRSVSVQDSVPVQVYLNGEFWYDTYMLERYDSHYFQEHYNITDYELIKSGEVSVSSTITDDIASYDEYMNWVATTDYSDLEQWQQFLKETDLQSYIDYISINYYLCNWDFHDDKNYLLWRAPSNDNSNYADNRWRWCIYDIDALEYTYRKYDSSASEINIFSCELPYIDNKVNETTLFQSLKNNPFYCRQFVLSFMDIVNNNFSLTRVNQVLEKHGLSMDWMDGFFRERPAYAATHLAEEFNLSGHLENVIIQTKQAQMGTIIVNTSQIDLSSGSWTGQYFTDYPITMTASPKEGYEFLGWKGAVDTTDTSITLDVDGGVTLEAVFAEIE